MGKINASLADVSTEFKPVDPGIYDFEITEVAEQERDGTIVGYKPKCKIITPGEMEGKVVSDYVSIIKKNGEINEVGLSQLKRYFEVTHGKDEVAGWTDDDYDTDMLVGKHFKAQVVIESYTPDGQTEPRQTNRFARIEEI